MAWFGYLRAVRCAQFEQKPMILKGERVTLDGKE